MKMVKQRHVVNLLEVRTVARPPSTAAPARPLTHAHRHLHTSGMALLFLGRQTRLVGAAGARIAHEDLHRARARHRRRALRPHRLGEPIRCAAICTIHSATHSAMREPFGRLRPPITRFIWLLPSQMSRRRASTSASSSLGLSTATARACATAISSRRTCCSTSRCAVVSMKERV